MREKSGYCSLRKLGATDATMTVHLEGKGANRVPVQGGGMMAIRQLPDSISQDGLCDSIEGSFP